MKEKSVVPPYSFLSRTEPLRGMSPFLAEAPGGDTLLDVHPTQLQVPPLASKDQGLPVLLSVLFEIL